uniref:Mei2-like C-terminal RNA recognition motif domain-containing protein n=1 Tax=Arcella intermedia TaxID=1963864 RepID=A0A6B2LFY5_9EUKA
MRNNFAEMATFEKSRSLSTGATPRGDREAGKTGKSMPSSPNHHFRYRHKAKTARHRQRSINSRKDEDLSKYELNPRRVAAGQDTRATLMIKNIPNKYDQEMLLEAINKRFRGSYDFFYLPIDFKNKCNVGYAFINFISYETVGPFFEEFNQKKWEKFNSEKVCKITYARIQGKNAFIDHFRNSSLMYEDLTCRPLIFHSSGPAIGELEQFPPANVLRRPNAPEDFQE